MYHNGSGYFGYERPSLEAINEAQRAHTELAKRAVREQVAAGISRNEQKRQLKQLMDQLDADMLEAGSGNCPNAEGHEGVARKHNMTPAELRIKWFVTGAALLYLGVRQDENHGWEKTTMLQLGPGGARIMTQH